MKYISTSATFIGGHLYRAGEAFDLPEGMRPAAEMTAVDGGEEKRKPGRPKKDAPETFSEIAKADSKAMESKG